jgi:hypothetical protein
MTLWVGLRGRSRHDPRVVANGVHGARMTIANPATVAVLPTPRLIRGYLPLVHQRLVFAWVARNAEALADYWTGAVGLVGLGTRLRVLPRFEVRRLARAARETAVEVPPTAAP